MLKKYLISVRNKINNASIFSMRSVHLLHLQKIQQQLKKQLLHVKQPKQLSLQSAQVSQQQSQRQLQQQQVKQNVNIVQNPQRLKDVIKLHIEMRKVTSLQQLHSFIISNRNFILGPGKTILLELLNEFYINPRQKQVQNSPIEFYLIVNEMQDLNIYEEILRYSIFKKLQHYCYRNQQMLIEWQQVYLKKINGFLQRNQADIGDAFNLIIALGLRLHQIKVAELALEIINKKIHSFHHPLKIFKIVSILIKRLIQLQKKNYLQYKNIQNYLCFEFNVEGLNFQDELMNILERLIELKFHLFGPQVIPKAIDQIYQMIIVNNLCLEEKLILRALKCFEYLPLNYNPQTFYYLMQYLLNLENVKIQYLRYIPYRRLNINLINLFHQKVINFEKQNVWRQIVYYTSSKNIHIILKHKIGEYLYEIIIDVNKRQNYNNIYDFQRYVGVLKPLIDILNKEQSKLSLLKIFKQCYLNYKQRYQDEILQFLSMVNMINLLSLLVQVNLKQSLSHTINICKKILSRRKNRAKFYNYCQQLKQMLCMHINTPLIQVQQMLYYCVSDFIKQYQYFQYNDLTAILFVIQSHQYNYFKFEDLSHKMIKMIPPNEIYLLAEQFRTYHSKNNKLMNFIMKILSISQKTQFKTIFEVTASSSIKHITSMKEFIIIQYQDINKISLKTITKCLEMLYNFITEIKNQIINITKLAIQKLHNNLIYHQFQEVRLNGKVVVSFIRICKYIIPSMTLSEQQQCINKIFKIIKLSKLQGTYAINLKVLELEMNYHWSEYLSINDEHCQQRTQEIIRTVSKDNKQFEYIEIILVLIKMHCMNYIQLKYLTLMHYINQCSIQHRLTSSIVKQALGGQILNISNVAIKSKIKQHLIPLTLIIYKNDNSKKNLSLLYYYTCLYQCYSERQGLIQVLKQICMEDQLIRPQQLYKITSILAVNVISNNTILTKVMKQLKLHSKYLSNEAHQFLFFIYKMFKQIPQQYIITLNILWSIAISQYQLQLQNIKKFKQKKLISILQKNLFQYIWIAIRRNQINELNFQLEIMIVMQYNDFIIENKIIYNRTCYLAYIFLMVKKKQFYIKNINNNNIKNRISFNDQQQQNKQQNKIIKKYIFKNKKKEKKIQLKQEKNNIFKNKIIIQNQINQKMKQYLQNEMNLKEVLQFTNNIQCYKRIINQAQSILQYHINYQSQQFIILPVQSYHRCPFLIYNGTLKFDQILVCFLNPNKLVRVFDLQTKTFIT